MQDCQKPVIVALNGTAAGGGAMLALAADVIIASDTARFVDVFGKQALIPDGGYLYLLPRIVGMHKAKEIVFFGETISAEDALGLGIVNKVVPGAELPAAAKEWGETLAAKPTKVLGWAKKLLHDATENSRGAGARERRRLHRAQRSHRGRRQGADGRNDGEAPARVEGLVAAAAPNPLAVTDLTPIKDRTAVVGIGQTAFGKGLPDTELSLACQAISMAIDDAGLTPADVDGLGMFSMEDGREVDVARNVGLGDITWFSQVGFGGGRGLRRRRPGRDGGGDGSVQGRGRVAGPQARREDAAARGPRSATGSPATTSGAGRSACCAPSTRSRSSPGAACTSTATPATTSRTSRSRSACTRRATRTRRWATSR